MERVTVNVALEWLRGRNRLGMTELDEGRVAATVAEPAVSDVEQVFGRGPVPGIAHADCHQTPGETVVQLPPGRTVPLSAPFGQYPFIHLHR